MLPTAPVPPRQLHKQLRLAHDIFVENYLWDRVRAGNLSGSAEKLSADSIFLHVEGDVRDLVACERLFKLFARWTPFGSEGDNPDGGRGANCREKASALILGGEQLLWGHRSPSPHGHEDGEQNRNRVSIDELN